MAQLFTVYFPQYCFELQEQFSITFSNANDLPFDPDVSAKGVPHIREIKYHHNSHRVKEWAASGLKEGLRIVSIDGKTLATEQEHGINTTSDNDILTQKELLSKIYGKGSSRVTFTFREDIPTFDDSEPLGLAYVAPTKIEADTEQEQKYQAHEYKIADEDISVSSFKQTQDGCYPPEHIRLNTPNGYWSPTDNNSRSRDVWVCFDLGGKKLVDMIQVQGNLDHTAYVQALWIEYSDDMCAWKSHPMRKIKCHYMASDHTKQEQKHDDEERKGGELGTPQLLDKTSSVLSFASSMHGMEYETASIKLWPVINAQFIRIRPTKWKDHIAMRLEILGNDRALDHQQIGKMVTANTVCAKFKHQLQPLLVNKGQDTSAIQIDCKAIVNKAMELAGCTSFSLIDTDDTNCLLVVTTPNAPISDRVMDSLTNIGVGRQFGVISSLPVEWRNAAKNIEQVIMPEDATSTGFAASVKSHKRVQVVVERIMNSAALTFDYCCMLVVASLIAVGGLATNSAVIVVASMLVSPIMGPVLAFTFGVTLGNRPMARIGVRNECVSLLICVLIGFVVGFFYALGTKNRNDWPTNEMAGRGDPWALSDGAFIAAASGVGVALSVLGDYLSTVVGVAISASLLPPAVNCGMLLSFCIYESIKPHCVEYPGCGTTESVHDYSIKDTAVSAAISLILTIENIIIIFLMGWAMFKVKDIVETKDRNQRLWDYISQFKAQHKRITKMKKKESKEGMMKELSGEQLTGTPSHKGVADLSFSAHGNFEFDVCTHIGSSDERAMRQVKKAIAYRENDIIHSTLKEEMFKRQVSTFYHRTRARGRSTSEDIDSDQSEHLLSPKQSSTKHKPHLSVIFSQQTTEDAPLMHDEGDGVDHLVQDENDP
eukprot:265124_1